MEEKYRTRMSLVDSDGNFVPRTLDKILAEALKENEIFQLAGQLLDITQVYFDCTIEKNDTRDTLEKLLEIDRKVVVSSIKSRELDLQDIRKELKGIYGEIVKADSNKNVPRDRYLDQNLDERKKRFISDFYDIAEKTFQKIRIDTIVYAASGGLEPALMIKALRPSAMLVPIRYSHYKARDTAPVLPKYISDSDFKNYVLDKAVLLIDDDIDTGDTMTVLLEELAKLNPRKLYCGVVLGRTPESYHRNFQKYVKLLSPKYFFRRRLIVSYGEQAPRFYIANLKAINQGNPKVLA